ncbi:MAG: GNAT family N-acetyltransferase [Geminicoccaceae bacterium]
MDTESNHELRTGPVAEVDDCHTLRLWLDAWNDLARRAIVANPFFESGALLAALEEGLMEPGWRILLIFDHQDRRRLIGLVPLKQCRFHPLIPQRIWRSLSHIYSFCSVPLIDREKAADAMSALLRWIATRASAPVDLEKIPVNEALWPVVQQSLKTHFMPRMVHNPFERAAMRPSTSADAYLANALRKKRRKELSRQRRRLEELGTLEMRHLGPADDPAPWIEQFIALESRGWKGRRGTAMAMREGDLNYFRRMVHHFHQHGRIELRGMYLDDQPIALKCNLVGASADRIGFAFKIAYDERFDSYSPGVQLEIEQIIHMHEDDASSGWMDSCASAEHFMINRLWTERRQFASILVGPPSIRGRSTIKALEGAAALHRIYAGKDGEGRELEP